MKKGWEYKKLGEVANVIHGKNQKEVLSTNGKYPIYGSGGTIMGYATEYLCEAGTTILGRKGTINNPQFINHKFWNVDTAFGISARKDIDSKFLYFFIKKQDWSKMNTGTTLPSLTQAIVKNVIIPLPPLSEQKEIVEYLDSSFAKIDKLKENAAKNLEEAKALFQSALKDALEPKEGCSYDKLVNVYNFIDYRGATPTKLSEGVPLITAKNVKYGYLDYTIKDFISEDEYSLRQSRGISHKGDLLFTTEAPLGNVAIADLDRFSAGQRLITFQKYSKSKYEVENKFYYFYMLSPVFQAKIKSLATGATAQGIKAKILKEIIVPIPSLPEQQSIVSFLDSLNEKVNTLQQNYSRICDECDALKQAILRQVFE